MLLTSKLTITTLQTNRVLFRCAATQLAVNVDHVSDEWSRAKPYSAIPSPSVIGTFRGFMPGGKYYNKKLHEVHGMFRDECGPIVKFKGNLGRRDVVMLFDPKDFETLFRNDKMWPVRNGMDAFVYYRKNIRNDVFKGVGGLVTE
jgi:cytochrome P450 family 12